MLRNYYGGISTKHWKVVFMSNAIHTTTSLTSSKVQTAGIENRYEENNIT